MVIYTAMEMLEKSEESLIPWIPSEGLSLTPTAVERIQQWWARAQGSYPPSTRKVWACDSLVFIGFCESLKVCPLPATPETVATFIAQCRIEGPNSRTRD